MDVKYEFQIAITKAEFTKMQDESVPDYNKNARGENVFKCRNLRGDWMNCIKKKINEFEGTNYPIIDKNGRMNPEKKTIRAKYFSATG
jgi:hypothetical protein